jgi:hypothetical protein
MTHVHYPVRIGLGRPDRRRRTERFAGVEVRERGGYAILTSQQPPEGT